MLSFVLCKILSSFPSKSVPDFLYLFPTFNYTLKFPISFVIIFANVILKFNFCRVVGSEAWELVAGIRVGRAGGLLAVVLVHTPEKSCEHGAIRRRSSEHKAIRLPHIHANGKWAFRRRGFRKSLLFPELAGRGLG